MSGTAPRRPVVDVHTPAPLAAQRLRNTLRLNAFTSMLGGLAATVAPGPLDNHLLGTGHPGWVRLVGVGLIVFASTVAAVGGSRTTTLLRGTPAIIAADTAWVVASAMTIVGNWYSSSGAATIAAVAGMVAFFAVDKHSRFGAHARQRKTSPRLTNHLR